MKLLILLSLISMNSFADVGNGYFLKCGKSLSFYTNAVGQTQATYLQGKNAISLNCEKEALQNSNVQTLFTCTEDRNGEGKILVTVQTGGVVGSLKTAYVEQEQMFPLEPKHLNTLMCK